MQNNHTPDKIEEVLNLLDGIKRAEPAPFFYTRVRARLEASRSTIWDRVSTLISRPVIAFAGVLLVLIINLFAIYSNQLSVNNNESTEVASSDDYSVVSNSFYDIENNNKP